MTVFPSLDITQDPYLMDERDPAKCHALESSLWELQVHTNMIN